MMTVTVRIKGRICEPTITIPISATILQLKHKISADFNVDMGNQTLSCGEGDNKEVLDNNRTIESYSHHYEDDIVDLLLQTVHSEYPQISVMVKYESRFWKIFQVNEGDSVGVLRQRIANESNWGLARWHINLVIHETEMRDAYNFRQYYVGDGSVIRVERITRTGR